MGEFCGRQSIGVIHEGEGANEAKEGGEEGRFVENSANEALTGCIIQGG